MKFKIFVFFILGFLLNDTIFSQKVYRLDLDTPIHQILEEYIVEGINKANNEGASLILITMDTPGGYIKNVERIQREIISSKAPVVVYVAPSGARAASGGALIAVTADFIAMAPGTTIGSAHPVSGIPFMPLEPSKKEKGEEEKNEQKIMLEKIINDINAHLRSIAEIRGRNPEPIQKMVSQSLSLTEKEALNEKVIELVANSENEVLEYLKGKKIKRFDGKEEILPSTFIEIKTIKMNLRQKILSEISNPEVAFLLLLIGILGLFVEYKSPGLIFPGVIGGIAILLYLLSLPLLPVNVIGILLIILGVIFFILEVKVVSYGILGIGGSIALIIGALMLYKGNPLTGEGLKVSFVIPIVFAFILIMTILIFLVIKAFKNPVQAGPETIIGMVGEVREKISPDRVGKVFVFGEYWNAKANTEIETGKKVKVIGIEGMTLIVEEIK